MQEAATVEAATEEAVEDESRIERRARRDIARREARCRRALARDGYMLKKSRTQNIHPNDLGGYGIVQMDINVLVAGWNFDLDLEEVEALTFKLKPAEVS